MVSVLFVDDDKRKLDLGIFVVKIFLFLLIQW